MFGFSLFLFLFFGGFAGLIAWDEMRRPSTTREDAFTYTVIFGICAIMSVTSLICVVV